MSSPLEQIIDHAAELQARVDQLEHEMLSGYVMVLALAFLVGFLTFQVWKAGR
jgi:hypothetical protein